MEKITTLESLRTSCERMVPAIVQLRGEKGPEAFRVDCRPITPALSLELTLLLAEVRPPNRKVRPEDPDQWDFEDPAYKKALETANHAVRILTVWHCCTLFDELRADGSTWTRERILSAVSQGVPDDNVLRQLCTQINAGASLADRVNFI